MTNKEKIILADAYAMKRVGRKFDELPVINDIDEADTQEDIIEMTKARIEALEHENDDIPLDIDDDDDEQDDYYGVGNFEY